MAEFISKIGEIFALGLLRAYKFAISPWLPTACRYVPTCSEYAMEAVERFGVATGTWMALRRVLRCHPFVKGGYDPVAAIESARNETFGGECKPGLSDRNRHVVTR